MTNNKIHYIITGLLFSLVIIIGLGFLGKENLPESLSEWQAVFLSDGQVYFGHLEGHNRQFVKLSNVHYLKYGSTLEETSDKNLNLIRLGGEVHGPENIMYISIDKILFIENLKDTSVVVGAMKK